jgi:hypothetical protein
VSNLVGKPLLVRILDTTHVFQQNYIQVHDVVLNQRLGARIDYANLLEVLKQVREVLMAVRELLNDPASRLDATYSDVVTTCVERLLAAVEGLTGITEKLYRVRENAGKYTFWAYWRDRRAYEKLVLEYQSVGETLNDIYRSVKS